MLSLQRGANDARSHSRWWTCFTALLSARLTSGHPELCCFSAITLGGAWRPHTIFLFTVHWLNIWRGLALCLRCRGQEDMTSQCCKLLLWWCSLVYLSGVNHPKEEGGGGGGGTLDIYVWSHLLNPTFSINSFENNDGLKRDVMFDALFLSRSLWLLPRWKRYHMMCCSCTLQIKIESTPTVHNTLIQSSKLQCCFTNSWISKVRT